MRVAVADDNAMLTHGMLAMLDAVDIPAVAVTGTGADLLDRLRSMTVEELPDVAIVDICMPPTFTDEGLVTAAAVRAEFPGVAVLVLSAYADTTAAARLLADGTRMVGICHKHRVSDLPTLVDALQRLASGGVVVDEELVAGLFQRPAQRSAVADLGEQQRTVLRLVAEGMNNKDIAARLFISVRTVEDHVRAIFDRLGLHDPSTNRRVLAAIMWLRNGTTS